MPQRKTAVIYARFSSSKQREASIEDQIRVCTEWCDREGYEVVKHYCDYALSGRTDDRPQFQNMIHNAGESDIVLVYMMDRFSRDPFDAPIYKRDLAKKGVKLVSALEAIPDSPEGIIYEKLLEGLAACESAKTAERVKRGMKGNALKCKTNGVNKFGYKEDADGCFAIDEEYAPFVREAFARRLKREPVHSIASDFARRGIKTKYGNPCSTTMITRMLQSEAYRGVYKFDDVRIEGGMPRLIDDATWYEVQGVKGKKRREIEEWGEFTLSGRTICSACGHGMSGNSGRGRHGKKYEYYKCTNCKEIKPVRKDWLEGEIVQALRDMLTDRNKALEIARMVLEGDSSSDTEAQLKQAEKALSEANKGIKNLMKAVEDGMEYSLVENRLHELNLQKAHAELEIESLTDDGEDTIEDFADFLQYGATLDDKTLLDAFVYQVMVTNDDIYVTLNYDEKENEPARLNISRVRVSCNWWTVRENTRIAKVGNVVVLRFPRKAA